MTNMACQAEGCRIRKGIKTRSDGLDLCDRCELRRLSEDRGDRDSSAAEDDVHDVSGATSTSRRLRIVINELLAYCIHHSNSSTRDSIKRVILDFYNPEEISAAKHTLWKVIGDQVLGKTKIRQDSHIRSRHESEISDILEALAKVDVDVNESVESVHFVAYDLGRLPRVAPEELDLTSVVLRLTDLESRFKSLDAKVAKNTDSVECLTDVSLQTTGYAHAARQHVQHTSPGHTVPRPPAHRAPPHKPTGHVKNDARNTALRSKPTAQTPSVNTQQPADQAAADVSDVAPVLDSDGFEIQRGERRRLNRTQTARQPVYGSSDTVSGLRAGKRSRDLFIFNLNAETSDDELKSFLLDNGIDAQEVECQSKENSFNTSYRLKVDSTDAEKLLKPEFWPANVGIRPYFRKRMQPKADVNTNEA